MPIHSVREAALQHLAANKVKAAAAVLERHLTENETHQSEKETPRYAINTFGLDAALRKGMETLEYLREVRASTEESHIKAVASAAVNREFREQSSWWLPKQELPQSWFPAPPSALPNKLSNGPRTPRAVSPKHAAPSTPLTAARGRQSASQLRAQGSSDDDIALLLGDASSASPSMAAVGAVQPPPAVVAAAASVASAATAGDLSPRRLARPTTTSDHRSSRGSLSGASSAKSLLSSPGMTGSTAGAPPAAGPAARVAWALSRRGGSTGGSDMPALYDGGGDEAVPGAGPYGPMQPPPGYQRYTVKAFQKHLRGRQQAEQQPQQEEQQSSPLQHSSGGLVGSASRGGRAGDVLVIQSDGGDEDAESIHVSSRSFIPTGEGTVTGPATEEGRVGSGVGLTLGTGFLALSEEEPHSGFQQVAIRTAVNNAESRGGSGVRPAFGTAVGPLALPTSASKPTTPRSASARGRARQQLVYGGVESPHYGSVPLVPELVLPSRQSSSMVPGLRASTTSAGMKPARTSSPGTRSSRVSSPGYTDTPGRGGGAVVLGFTGPSRPTSAAPSPRPNSPRVAAEAAPPPPPLQVPPTAATATAATTGTAWMPTPPPQPQQQSAEAKSSSSTLRLGGRPQPPFRSNLTGESSGHRVSAPGSPPSSARAALSGLSGRLRLGTVPSSSTGTDGADGSPAQGGGAAAVRARLRVLSVPGAEDEGSNYRVNSPGGGNAAPFMRSILAPASPSGLGPCGSSTPLPNDLLPSGRFSERSLLATCGSVNGLDSPASSAFVGGVSGGGGASTEASSPRDHPADTAPATAERAAPAAVAPPPARSLSRTFSRRRIGRSQSQTGEPPSSSPDHGLLSVLQQQTHPKPPAVLLSPTVSPNVETPSPTPSPPLASPDTAPRPPTLQSQTSVRLAHGRRPSNSGGRTSPVPGSGGGSGAAASPPAASPPPPDLSSGEPEARVASVPLPGMPSPSNRPRQLQRGASRSRDAASPPPHHHASSHMPAETETIIEERGIDSSSGPEGGAVALPQKMKADTTAAPQGQALSLRVSAPPPLQLPLQAARPGSGGALLPSPRPVSAHSSSAGANAAEGFGSPASLSWRAPAASTPSGSEYAVSAVAMLKSPAEAPAVQLSRETELRHSVSSGRTRRTSLPSGLTEPPPPPPLVVRSSQPGRMAQPGGTSEGRPWQAPSAISPKLLRAATVSGSVAHMPTALSGRPQVPSPSPLMLAAPLAGPSRSTSVSGGLPSPQSAAAPTAAAAATGAVRTASAANTPAAVSRVTPLSAFFGYTEEEQEEEEAPVSATNLSPPPQQPQQGGYRLSVGPMPGARRDTVFINQTLDI